MMIRLLVTLLAVAMPPAHAVPVTLPTDVEVLRTLPPVAEEKPVVPRTSGEWVDPPELPRSIAEPRLVVHKSQRRIELWSGDEMVRAYRIALGLEPIVPKRKQGDYATPEGTSVDFALPSGDGAKRRCANVPAPMRCHVVEPLATVMGDIPDGIHPAQVASARIGQVGVDLLAARGLRR